MKTFQLNGISFHSEMKLPTIRSLLFDYYNTLLSDKIRVYSMVYMKSKEICQELGMTFEGYFLAIGELNAQSFSYHLQEKGGFLSGTLVSNQLEENKRKIIQKLEHDGVIQYQYDLTGAGYSYLRKLLSEEELRRTGIVFSSSNEKNEIFVVNGASSGLKFTFEMLYRKLGRKVKTLFPVPLFMPIIHASDIFLESILYETNEKNQFKITMGDIETITQNKVEIDAFYLCLLNNPTSISYSREEVEKILQRLFKYNKNIQVIIDGVYISGGDVREMHKIFKMIEENNWLENIILVDGEGKSKARTGKRSGSIYVKNVESSRMLSNIIRNSTGGIGSDIMLETINVLETLDVNFSQELYFEVAQRRASFLKYIFNHENISQYLEDISHQYLLPISTDWKGGLYAFIKLKPGVSVKDFILLTGIIGTPGEVFGGKNLENYMRLSFGYENINGII